MKFIHLEDKTERRIQTMRALTRVAIIATTAIVIVKAVNMHNSNDEN
jgi:heme/copper-type cytochrome/quinol oxidase subunit 4